MPASPCHDLLDDCDAQFSKVTFDTNSLCSTFSDVSDAGYASNTVDGNLLPYKSPCAAYFDGCDDDFSLTPLGGQCNSLSLSPPSPQESTQDVAPRTVSSASGTQIKMVPCATNIVLVGMCSMQQPQSRRNATCVEKIPPSKIQYSYDTLTSRCDDSCAHSPNAGDARKPLLLADFFGPSEKKPHFMDGKVWVLSQDAQGCRAVQTALDDCLSAHDIDSIAMQMRGHVWEAMRCPHANHVLRKIVQNLPPATLDFIIQEIIHEGAAGVKQFASHRYGCRVVEELLRTCGSKQLHKILSLLLAEAEGLCTHMYGNFVMKAFLQHSSLLQRQMLVNTLLDNAVTMGTNFYACAILAEVFQSDDAESWALACVVVRTRGLLSAMACHKHGRAAVDAVLRKLKGAERQAAVNELALPPLKIAKASKALKNSRA